MSTPVDLLALLPPIYRTGDAGGDRLLPRLAEALAGPAETLSIAADELYDEWFIGTCSLRAMALIGDLVGVDTDPQVAAQLPTWRRYVANVAAYRRRKGGVDTLACAAAAASGWSALARLDTDVTRTEDMGVGDDAALADSSPAFDRAARTLALASPGPEAEAITLFLWRLHVYPARRLAAMPLGGGRYMADPLGVERPMYRPPRTDTAAVHRVTAADVPLPLTVATLAKALANPPEAGPLGPGVALPVVLRVDGRDLAPTAMVAADLTDWSVDWPADARAAIDPARGRILLHPNVAARQLTVDRHHAAPADIGGGAYRRAGAGDPVGERVVGGGDRLAHALSAGADRARTIEIADSLRYDGGLTITVTGSLVLRARAGETPCIAGDILLRGGQATTVVIDGLWIGGTVRIEGGIAVELRDCTVRGEGIQRRGTGAGPMKATRSILSRVHDLGGGEAVIGECLVDGPVNVAGTLAAEQSTFLEDVHAGSVIARDSLFAGPLGAAATTEGVVANCYLAPGSMTAHRVDCVGDGREGSVATPRPLFVSRRYGAPGFGQLDDRVDAAIATGASNGWEMGCFNAVAAPLRHAALDQAIADIAPWRWQVRRVIVA